MVASDELREQYARRFEASRTYRDGVWKSILNRRLQSWVGHDKDVLDLGCGWGEFTRNVRARKKFAMDLNPDAAQMVGDNVHFMLQDCSERWALEDNSLDVIFSSNFIEHLPNKDAIGATLVEAHRCLRRNGKIIFLGPNISCVGGAYWDYWDHHVPITDRSLVELLSLSGFDVTKSIPRFLPYTMSDGREAPLFMVNLYLRMPIFWPLLGKQFLVIAQTT